jgi:hypothetical protein
MTINVNIRRFGLQASCPASLLIFLRGLDVGVTIPIEKCEQNREHNEAQNLMIANEICDNVEPEKFDKGHILGWITQDRLPVLRESKQPLKRVSSGMHIGKTYNEHNKCENANEIIVDPGADINDQTVKSVYDQLTAMHFCGAFFLQASALDDRPCLYAHKANKLKICG